MTDKETDGQRVIGIDLGGTKIFGALVDPSGRLEDETYLAHEEGTAAPGDEGERALASLVKVVATLRDAARSRGHAVRGIGVGAPGIVHDGNIVVSAPPLGWRNLPLAERLHAHFGLRACVENDSNTAGLGEARYGAGRGVRNLVCVTLGTGIGGAVIVDGKLHRGKRGAAGEVGGFLPGLEFAGWDNPEWGALESIASGSGVANQARQMPEAGPSRDKLRTEDVFAAAADKVPWAVKLVDQTIGYLTLLVAGIQVLLDPDIVILAGGMARSADQLIPAIEKRLARAIASPPHLVRSELGYRAAVLGAATLV